MALPSGSAAKLVDKANSAARPPLLLSRLIGADQHPGVNCIGARKRETQAWGSRAEATG